MKKPLLDLYITHWNEGPEIWEKGIRMLALQRGIDWEQIHVTIVHDGSQAFPPDLLHGMPYAPDQVCLEHGGIARARNWCIDHGDGTWIKWCDCDDMFSNAYSLRNIMQALEQDPPMDLLWFDMYAEDAEKNKVFLKNDRDPVTIHAKIFRRTFLRGHRIRFPEDLTWCEDSAMLAVVEMEIDHQRIGKIKTEAPVYCWIARQGSLCNRPEVKFANLKSFFRRHCYVQEEFRKRGQIEAYTMMTARVLVDSCYTLTLAGLEEDTSEHESAVWGYYKKHRDELLQLQAHQLQDVIDAVNRENGNSNITRESFLAWLRELSIKKEGGN